MSRGLELWFHLSGCPLINVCRVNQLRPPNKQDLDAWVTNWLCLLTDSTHDYGATTIRLVDLKMSKCNGIAALKVFWLRQLMASGKDSQDGQYAIMQRQVSGPMLCMAGVHF